MNWFGAPWPIAVSVAAFVVSALIIGVFGVRPAGVVDRLAHRTGLGKRLPMLFIAVADGVYQQGSIYAAVTEADIFVVGWTMALIAILGAGLVRRQRHGIGFEGTSILALYAAGAVTVLLMG